MLKRSWDVTWVEAGNKHSWSKKERKDNSIPFQMCKTEYINCCSGEISILRVKPDILPNKVIGKKEQEQTDRAQSYICTVNPAIPSHPKIRLKTVMTTLLLNQHCKLKFFCFVVLIDVWLIFIWPDGSNQITLVKRANTIIVPFSRINKCWQRHLKSLH